MAHLLSIGDFSRMTFLTVKALRHYHDVGLLAPADVDPHSGYRSYLPEQVATARLIRRLRDLDLPVIDVRAVLEAPDEEARNAVIVTHLDRMSRQLQQTQDTVASLRRLLSDDEPVRDLVQRVDPAQTVLAIREVVGGDRWVSWWMEGFTELHRQLRSSGVERAAADGACYSTEFFTDGSGEMTVFLPVVEAPPPGRLTGRVEVMPWPGGPVAVTTYDGPLVDLDGAYSFLGRAVMERAIASDGPVVERYLPNGPVVHLPDDLLHHTTEICWPIAR